MNLDPHTCYRAILARDVRHDGRFFTCVRTTGIYCRPICPARPPKFENCIFVPSAAAAHEAGFRPCLRCRPESSPNVGAWRGTSATVSRALRLIEAGALDDGSVDALAARLGVGERQLRRLFQQHLGASPLSVAQSRRVLLAQQLIHQTSLPMIAVAHGSGFTSIRRFNETFQQLFGRSPSEMRRGRGRTTDRGAPVSLTLPYRPPYDWDALIEFLRKRAIPGVETVSRSAYRRVIRTGSGIGWIKVEHAPWMNALRATVYTNEFNCLPDIIARIRRMFDLAADPLAITNDLGRDPLLAPLVAARPGLRVPGTWDGFEAAVRAVLGQQITVSAATALAGRFAAAFGEPVADLGGLTHAFPQPDDCIDEKRIAGLGIPEDRAAAIAALARAACVDPDLFGAGQILAVTIARLKDLPGIGDWTANYTAMRGMGENDAFPAGDVGLVQALEPVFGRRPTSEELLERAEAWRPWRAYAALHLWTGGPSPVSARHSDGATNATAA